MADYRLIPVKSIAECSKRALCNTFDLHKVSLNAGLKYCRMLQESILLYFRPSLSYHLSLRSLSCLFLSGSFGLFFAFFFSTIHQPQTVLSNILVHVYFSHHIPVLQRIRYHLQSIYRQNFSKTGTKHVFHALLFNRSRGR